MPDTLDVLQYDLPAGVLLDPFDLDGVAAERSLLLAQLRNRIETSRVKQGEWALRFVSLYEEARRNDWSEPFLTQWAVTLLERQRGALERFHPMIEGLQLRAAGYAAKPDPELLEIYQASIELILGWITPYQRLCGKLLELAAERRDSGDKILRARPVEGEVDYAELSREIIARFPKILAALAE
jgi:hypothetical protein